MRWKQWFFSRNPRYLYERGAAISQRYGITSAKSKKRIQNCMRLLADSGCLPTLPTPGRVVDGNPAFISSLQEEGAEIAVHSYEHVDLTFLPPQEAVQQLVQGVQAFTRHGIEVHGFRCPYLKCSDELLDALPPNLFSYSSNRAVEWEAFEPARKNQSNAVYLSLNRFYRPDPADRTLSVPFWHGDRVEIPVCVPDDLQFFDGLKLRQGHLAEAWSRMLRQIYQRGELFTLIFHPELSASCYEDYSTLLEYAGLFWPPVWFAQLRDIGAWWRERSAFKVEIVENREDLRLHFGISPKATLLARNLQVHERQTPWDGTYFRLPPIQDLNLPANQRPFIGIAPATSARRVNFLKDQGYILDTGETAPRCSIFFDEKQLSQFPTDLSLIQSIEESPAPLLRIGRWPDGAKSALCFTGDLDALSLFDYASRLFR